MANPGMRHAYKSAKPDPVDTTLVGATKWNAAHYFLEDDGVTASGTLGDLLYRGTGGLITLLTGAQGVLTSAGSGNVPAWSMSPTLTSPTVTTIIIGAVTIDATDAAKIDGITNGTTAASKALVTDANGAMSILRTASLRLGTSGSETTVTATGAEINTLAGVTAGTVTASKALVVDANKDLASLRNLTLTGAFAIGTNPAASGIVRVANNQHFYWRNAANNADIQAIGVNNSDQVYLDPGAVGTQVGNGGPTIFGVSSVLGIGGKTSSFPGLKRNGQTLQVRLADDSADASLMAAIFIPGSYYLGPGSLQATVGDLRLANASNVSARNAANSGNLTLFQTNSSNQLIVGDDGSVSTATVTILRGASNIIAIGGVTSSFPALKRSSAELQARLADDSAYANFRCANLTFGTHSTLSGETVTGYITVTDAAGNSRKLAVVS